MNENLELRWVYETLADPPPEPPVLVDGMLRAGTTCVLAAPRAIGKSWAVMNLAKLVASGRGLFLGALEVRDAAPVLVCHGELSVWSAARRWGMLCRDEPPHGLIESFDRWHLEVVRQRAIAQAIDGQRVDEERWTGRLDERVRRAVQQEQIGLLIVDPWACFYTGEENSNDQTEAALGELRALAQDEGCAVVVVHHLGKSMDARDIEDTWRGASRLADWPDVRVTLLPHFTPSAAGDEGLSPAEARLYVDVTVLSRHDEHYGSFPAMLGPDGWWTASERAPTSIVPRIRFYSPDDVAQALRADGGRWASVEAARAALDLSKDGVRKVLQRAIDAGTIHEIQGRGGARAFILVELVEPALLDEELS